MPHEAAQDCSDEGRQQALDEGLKLIKERNRLLTLSDKYGRGTAATDMADPITGDSEDEKIIHKARKEAQLVREEKIRQARSKTAVRKSLNGRRLFVETGILEIISQKGQASAVSQPQVDYPKMEVLLWEVLSLFQRVQREV